MMADATPVPQTRKRRSRTSNSSDEGVEDGRKRGRPRVDKQDESAADRRRTQIRMAQRAYRQRKESTLEDLRKRVSELTTTIELMNRAFIDCREKLTTAGLPEALFQDVQETTKQYESLMKCVRNPSDEHDPNVPSLGGRSISSGSSDVLMRDTAPKNVPSWLDESVLNQTPRGRPANQVGMGYTMYIPDPAQPMLDYFDDLEQNSNLTATQKRPQPHPNSLDALLAESSSVPSALTPPMTYSFQETTFGRRLHRASLERGYQLLLDLHRRPKTYERVFRLSLMIRDREKLIAAIKAKLDVGPHENLDANAPLIHVGGAGTHYPRRDPFGNLLPKKESYNLGFVGPHMLALLDNAARNNLTTDMTVDIAGFEGEWFDPYDVEGYLAEKGIHIDPSSSFAEAEVMVWSSPSSTTATEWPKPFDQEQIQDLNRSFVPEGIGWNDLNLDMELMNIMNMSDVGFSDVGTGSWMNFLLPGQSVRNVQEATTITPNPLPTPSSTTTTELITWEGSHSTEYLSEPSAKERVEMFQQKEPAEGRQRVKRRIVIDVAKFVKVMVVSSACIGRTPGYKRRDVDRALALSSFDAL